MSHLGVTHIDEGALRYMIEAFGVNSMFDIGCGPGGQVKLAKALGVEAWGIDRDPAFRSLSITTEGNVVHDFTAGPLPVLAIAPLASIDLGWCVEFLEHIPEDALPNVWPTLRQCRYLMLTAAPPGHGGVGHVNEQPWDYWRVLFEQQGYVVAQTATAELRKASSMERNFIRERGYVLVRIEEW